MLISLMRNENGFAQVEVEKLVTKELETLFAIEKNVTIKLLLNLIGYILSNEFVEYCEQGVFQQKGHSFWGFLDQVGQQEQVGPDGRREIVFPITMTRINGRFIISVWTVLWPIWSRYKGVLSNLSGSLSTVRTLGLKLAGCHHQF